MAVKSLTSSGGGLGYSLPWMVSYWPGLIVCWNPYQYRYGTRNDFGVTILTTTFYVGSGFSGIGFLQQVRELGQWRGREVRYPQKKMGLPWRKELKETMIYFQTRINNEALPDSPKSVNDFFLQRIWWISECSPSPPCHIWYWKVIHGLR